MRGSVALPLLFRRSLSDRSLRAYYRVSGPVGNTLDEAVRVAGRRWSIEVGLEEAKGEVWLDQYEVRGFRAWYRHMWPVGLVSCP